MERQVGRINHHAKLHPAPDAPARNNNNTGREAAEKETKGNEMKNVTIKFFDTGSHGTATYFLERGQYAWAVLGDAPSGNGDWAEMGPDALIARLARQYDGPRVGQSSRWYLGGAEVVAVEDVPTEAAQRVYASLGRDAARDAASAADDAQRLRWAATNAATEINSKLW